MINACKAGDVTQLRRWARQGVRVVGAGPLCHAASRGLLDVCRILIKELGADVHKADTGGFSPVFAGFRRFSWRSILGI
jgi:hypothetical protein